MPKHWISVHLKPRKRGGFTSYIAAWWDGSQRRYGRSFRDKDTAEEYRGKLELFVNGRGPEPQLDGEADGFQIATTPRREWAATTAAWLDGRRSREKTKASYRSFLKLFGEAAKAAYIEDVTESDVRKFLAGLQSEDRAAATIAAYLRVLAIFFRDVRPNDCPVTEKLVAQWAPYRKHKRQRPHYFTQTEYKKIIEACASVGQQKIAEAGRGKGKPGRGAKPGERTPLWWRAFITLLYRGGLRFNEAARLLWRDVDFDACTISIQPHAGLPGVLPWKPKGKANRKIPLTAELSALLVEMQEAASEGIPYVFLSAERYVEVMKSKPGPEKDLLYDVGKGFTKIRNRAGVAEGSLHDWRRTAITNWLKLLPPTDVQLLAGHEDIKTTLEIYNMVNAADVLVRAQKALAVKPKKTRVTAGKSRKVG